MTPISEPQISLEQFTAFVQLDSSKQLSVDYLALQTRAATLRQEIDALYKPLYEQHTFLDLRGDPIPFEANQLFLCEDDAEVHRYYDECTDAIAVAGYDVKPGYCPALMAATDLLMKEVEIVEAISKFVGVAIPTRIEDRKKMRDIFLKAAAAAK